MLYNSFGVWISIIFLLLLGVFFFFNIKPKFVLPAKYFHKNRYLLFRLVNIILLISIVLLPLDLQFITNKKIISEKILPVQILFDVSLSMAADDIPPSRFVASKEALAGLIKNLEGYNVSLITFSGIPLLYVPFSTDTNAILQKRNATNLGDFPPTEDFVGTAIGDALLLGISNLDKIKSQNIEYPGVIILITDGDSNKGYDPEEVMGLIQKKKVPVFTLGVGESDYLIGYDNRRNPVKTSINIPLLQKISKETGGEFYRVLETSNFEDFFEYIKDVIKSQEKETIENQYFALNQYLLVLIVFGLVFLLYIQIKNIAHSK